MGPYQKVGYRTGHGARCLACAQPLLVAPLHLACPDRGTQFERHEADAGLVEHVDQHGAVTEAGHHFADHDLAGDHRPAAQRKAYGFLRGLGARVLTDQIDHHRGVDRDHRSLSSGGG